jgi:hypothetical protein
MPEPRRRETKRLIERELANRRLRQISSTNHIRHAHLGIINHHCKLVGKQPVCPLDYEITHLLRGVIAPGGKNLVDNPNGLTRKSKTVRQNPASGIGSPRTIAAGSGIDSGIGVGGT